MKNNEATIAEYMKKISDLMVDKQQIQDQIKEVREFYSSQIDVKTVDNLIKLVKLEKRIPDGEQDTRKQVEENMDQLGWEF